ncbi:MAG TPA: phosphatase PAP2 family protein [Solirubrobacterales bacterium]|nr:phosphatase PAP2 family protein [Solirubrobacterales bacterium]
MLGRRPGAGGSSPWRPLVKGVAVAALGAAVAVPLLRKRCGVHPAVTTAALAAGPPALAVVKPRTPLRDAGMYALQMWMFLIGHELPNDDPERLRSRLRVGYPIRVDRALGAGELPNVRLQRALAGLGRRNLVDRFLSWVHWSWFIEPHACLTWILARDPEHFARSARQMSGVFDLGCIVYAAVPTAPPWWASQEGYTDARVRRIMEEVGEEEWGRAWPVLYDALGGNPWAAMPSLHFATSLMAALLLAESGAAQGAAGWAYAGALGFALLYLGEHYVVDLLVGAAIVVAVRRGERYVEPVALAVSRGLQRLERLANE